MATSRASIHPFGGVVYQGADRQSLHPLAGAIDATITAAGGATNINAITHALTLTENPASLDITTHGATDAKTLTTFQATITSTASTNIDAITKALTLTTYAAAITQPQPSAAVSGTIVGAVEADVVSTGGTLIITLTNDTWLAAGTGPIGSTAQSQALIDGITSAQVEAGGWNTTIRDVLVPATHLARTSATIATLTIPATAGYVITATETITPTIPAAVLVTSGSPVVASAFQIKSDESQTGEGLIGDIVTDMVQDVISDMVT